VDFPLFQRLALPITSGRSKIPGIKIHDTRMVRMMEVLLHGGTQMHGWRSTRIRLAILTTFGLTPETYSLNQVRYDLRKMKAHGLIEREPQRYCYRLTAKGARAGATLRSLPQTRLWPDRQLPVSSSTQRNCAAKEQDRDRLPQSRSRYSECRRHACGLTNVRDEFSDICVKELKIVINAATGRATQEIARAMMNATTAASPPMNTVWMALRTGGEPVK
jgi:hypothetical protein